MPNTDAASKIPLLRMRGIRKSFPGVNALKGVDLTLYPGEVLALLGENGAGKSTLIKILGGAHQPDEGVIEINNQTANVSTPQASQASGIGIIYQEFNLIPFLTVRENIFLGQEPKFISLIHKKREEMMAKNLFDRIGINIPIDTECNALSVAHQQIVEIAKTLAQDARIIVMDEPSAALSPRETEGLFKVIEELKSQGIGVIYISHRLDEIFEISDRITFLRDGQYIDTLKTKELSRDKVIELMVGRSMKNEFPKRNTTIGDSRLKVSELSQGNKVQKVSFEIKSGEVVGLTGLVGAGRTETARLLFGAEAKDSGDIELDGKLLSIKNPRDAIRQNICLLTEDRKSQGLILNQTIRENFSLPNLLQFCTWSFIRKKAESNALSFYVDQIKMKITSTEQTASTLSGGNQQKVVLSKWLQRNAEVIIFDEPTRGIDVGAKYEIYQLINQLAEKGKAILMISSELPEILGMSDRVIVMNEGRITGEICSPGDATQEDIMRLATKGETIAA
ncbi:MAG: sugar ABC transporter ATP-binding protein [Verrucomicrobiota bacterium]|nr:sugar ABC transporter ATP-binding protein [Verrucomicrobiota bacterium]